MSRRQRRNTQINNKDWVVLTSSKSKQKLLIKLISLRAQRVKKALSYFSNTNDTNYHECPLLGKHDTNRSRSFLRM